MKLNISQLLSAAALVKGLVESAQSAIKGAGRGVEKHVAVANALKQSLPVVEGIANKDVADDALFGAALDALIRAEKTLLSAKADAEAARQAFEAVVADIKAKR